MAQADRSTNQPTEQASPAMPALTLPKGGGAIRGIGEKFAANPVTGTGSLTIPLAISPGRSNFAPQLSLAYDSGAGNSNFGMGWHLSLPLITRKTDKGLPRYQAAKRRPDVFMLSGMEDLTPELKKNAAGEIVRDAAGNAQLFEEVRGDYQVRRFRPRIEGMFVRLEQWTHRSTGEQHWRSITQQNVTTLYGKTAASRIADPFDATRIFSWLICASYDDKGNAILYEYAPEDSLGVDTTQAHEANRNPRSRSANRYIKRIKYGNRKPNRDANWLAFDPALLAADEWMFEVVFDYGEHDTAAPKPDDDAQLNARGEKVNPWLCRHDTFSSYRSGFEIRTYRLCQRVLMFHHFPGEANVERDCLVRSTDFVYQNLRNHAADVKQGHPIASFIASVTQNGYRRRPAGGYVKRSFPPLEFIYSQAEIDPRVQEIDAESLENLPDGLDGSRYQWLDLDGEGINGILTEQADGWFYKRNLSPLPQRLDGSDEEITARFAPIEQVAVKPAVSLNKNRLQFLDLAGDGQLDLAQFDGALRGFYERTAEADWLTFRPFEQCPNVNVNDANLKFIDLDGDGHSDILISEDERFRWHPSLAEEGFGAAEFAWQAEDEEQGARLIFADQTQTIFLADMSGDGLTDLVRIRNGEICYWPNLGYGRFGAKVTMDNAPQFAAPDLFNPRRLRLGDVDGSGTTDLFYLAEDAVHLWRNQAGNSWSAPARLEGLPITDNLSDVAVVDLLGNGTACLVWSSPLPEHTMRNMRYVDLMGGQKPHLLIGIVNNLGAETRIHYAPSTRFYLADKSAGKPWITRLPFPVHVVERVETFDFISRNRFVTRFAYHHGFFDGVEREFRGFGMVEQFDTEEFAALGREQAFPAGTNFAESSDVPTVLTRTWFHTGAYLGGERISNLYAEEYYREPGLTDEQARAFLLDDTRLPNELSADEERQACRALKGAMLRQEVFALDDSKKARHPYSVTEQNFALRLVQAKEENPYAVFYQHGRETLNFHYERNPADPRISHTMTLAVDEFGNLERSAAISYRRRPSAAVAEAEQKETHIAFTVRRFAHLTNEADDYRVGLPVETRTYEVVNAPNPKIAGNLVEPFSFATIAKLTQELFPLHVIEPATVKTWPYEKWDWRRNAANAPADTRLRLVEHLRMVYRKSDLTAMLPLGQIDALALPGEVFRLAFPQGLLAQIYQRKIGAAPPENLLPSPAAVLAGQKGDQGGYVDLDGNGNWWIPSGRSFYTPAANITNPALTAASERLAARQQFFAARKVTDAFGNATIITYDAHQLLVVKLEDAAQNIITALQDYRVLQPRLLTDANGNRSAVAFDALGLVVGSAVMGKALEPDGKRKGDLLDDFIADLDEATILDHLDNPLADPHAILKRATTRLVYDLFAYRRTAKQLQPQPIVVYTLSREKHDAELNVGEQPRVQHSFSYSDGFGREIQKKIQAEPGAVAPGGAIINQRWVGSGWTIFNNKGKPVRQYEPFFSTLPERQHRFEFARQQGVSPIVFYDPLERVVAALNPNHSWEKIGFDSWQQTTWDSNDTVSFNPATDDDVRGYFLRLADNEYLPTWRERRVDATLALQQWPDNDPVTGQPLPQNALIRANEKAAALATALHADTPVTAHFDSLGRAFLNVSRNRFARLQPDNTSLIVEEEYRARVVFDAEGNQREVIDTKGRVAMRYDYDMLGNRVHQSSMEAGERWTLNDVKGKAIRSWDSRSHNFRIEYDALRRPLRSFVRGADSANPNQEILFDRVVYGETHTQSQNLNLRGGIALRLDQGGLTRNEGHDFKGNLLVVSRRLARQYRKAIDWSSVEAALPQTTNAVLNEGALTAALTPFLEAETFTSRTRFDALNRVTEQTTPDNSVYRPTYNEANLLDKVEVGLRGAAPTTFVANINYNARGQRELIAYGNGATTTYSYDPLTFRLRQLRTTRPAALNGLASQIFKDSSVVQDLRYTFDTVGNITRIDDAALRPVFHNGQQVNANGEYVYDALYRLVEARGREHIGQSAFDFAPPEGKRRDFPFFGQRANANDLQALRNYTERYEYDEEGNFQFLRHVADGGNWTRAYEYEEASLLEPATRKSNRLTRTKVGNVTESYDYKEASGRDAQGCMTAINTRKMLWDFAERLQQVDMGGGGKAYYVYAADGQRLRKVIENQTGTRRSERLYIGGFEVYREYQLNGTSVALKRESLHVMDDKQRLALVETRTIANGSPVNAPIPLPRYQLGNHLGSAILELTHQGALISYEEYHPFGTTAYQAFASSAEISLKRYRYTGKERDEETGFTYHGARYYAPWLGRWTSCDPAGLADGTNLFRYVRNAPISFLDASGHEPNDSEEAQRQKDDQQIQALGITRQQLIDFAMMGRGDFIEKYGIRFWWNFPREKARALPGDLLYRVLPKQDQTLYQQPSGRVATNADEKSDVVKNFNPGTPVGGVTYTLARGVGMSHEHAQIAGAVGDLANAALPAKSSTEGLVTPRGGAATGKPTTYTPRVGPYKPPAPTLQSFAAANQPANPANPSGRGGQNSASSGSPPSGGPTTVASELFKLRDEAYTEAWNRAAANPESARTPRQFGNLIDEIWKDKVQEAINQGRLPSTFRVTPTSRRGAHPGVDVYDTATGEGYDLHPANEKQVLKHMDKYEGETMPDGTVIHQVNPIVYESPWR